MHRLIAGRLSRRIGLRRDEQRQKFIILKILSILSKIKNDPHIDFV